MFQSAVPALKVGDGVYAKYEINLIKGSQFYKGHVALIKDIDYCRVAFEDGSTSDDMLPEDIRVSHTW